MDQYHNKLAFYTRDKRLYILIIDNVNNSTGMVYFKPNEAYRLRTDLTFGQYETTKTNLSNFPIGMKMDRLPGGKAILMETVKYSNVPTLLQSEKLRQWLANRFNYESKRQKLEKLIENTIRRILKEESALVAPNKNLCLTDFNAVINLGDKLQNITTGVEFTVDSIENGILTGTIIQSGYESLSQLGKEIKVGLNLIGNKYKIVNKK
jgi:hypothetical protein